MLVSFAIGQRYQYEGLFGGHFSAEVVNRTEETVTMKTYWVAEDTGDLCSAQETFMVDIDLVNGTPVEYAVIWTYGADKGYLYAEHHEGHTLNVRAYYPDIKVYVCGDDCWRDLGGHVMNLATGEALEVLSHKWDDEGNVITLYTE